MTRFGYTLMTEQSGPKELVGYSTDAEDAGFDFLVSSDHYFPWLDSMGHSPYAWAVLGAVSQVTEKVELMTYVTCPTMRYHPVVVAQKAATLAILSDGRFMLGLGSGENLNEHVVGRGWPAVAVRHSMLAEAVDIIRRLHTGEQVTFQGDHFRVDMAKVWDLPDEPVALGVAVGGEQVVQRFATLGDHLIATEPSADLVDRWDDLRSAAGLGASRKIGQIPICWGRGKTAAVERAYDLFRWFGGGWSVMRICRYRRGSRGQANSSVAKTLSLRSHVVRTWMQSSRRSHRTGGRDSPTSPSSRSATSTKPRSSRRSPRSCSTGSAPRPEQSPLERSFPLVLWPSG